MLDAFPSPRAASTASAQASKVPPTQKPKVLTRSAPLIASAVSMAAITPSSR